MAEDSAERQSTADAAELLGQLLLQDVERKDDGVSASDGVSRDRIMSVHDPELRHGHKAAIVVDTDSQLITAVDVLPGNAPDNLGTLELVEESEASAGATVVEAMGGYCLRRRRHPPGFCRCGTYTGGPSARPA